MNKFLQNSRLAFRALHGLDSGEGAPAESEWFGPARRHRVLGLWAADDMPEQWQRAVYGQALCSARLTGEAIRIMRCLKDPVRGLRLVKGPILAQQAWPQDGLRSFDDLDFRCEKSSLPKLVNGLAALGYRVKAENDAHRDNLWHFGWGLEFRHPDGFMVEVNHRMFPPHFPWPEHLTHCEELWQTVMLDGDLVKCPVPALHLLLACAHAAWHGWERLGWLADIAGLLVRHPGLLDQAERLAGSANFLSRSLRTGCAVAARVFGPFPGLPAVEKGLAVDQALALLMSDPSSAPAEVQRRIHRQLMLPHEFVLYTFRRLTTPGDLDFRKWSLPARFRWMYWMLRPLRSRRG